MPKLSSAYPLDVLLRLLDDGFDHKAWHGPNLRGALRRVDATTAAWRPIVGRHNIWEHTVHAAYWKYAIRRRILGENRGAFALKGSNWFVRPIEPTEKAWKADLKLLVETHATLRNAIENLSPDDLAVIPPGCKLTNAEAIYSIALHDVYHAGQVQLIKRLGGKKADD